jgi:catechol 2,3-dioxygenase-like lactoylglutathione lyase family enzyme
MRFNKLVPEFSVSNYEKSLKFYRDIIGFKIEYTRKNPKFAFLSIEGSQLMIEEGEDKVSNSEWYVGKRTQPFGRGVHFQIEVKNLRKIINSLKKNNYPLKSPPKERWFRQNNNLLGMYSVLVQDPDGYMFLFNQDLGKK